MARKKLEGNGLWEGSRMIMPEHKARILNDSLREEIRSKPDLDPQALAEISRVLAQSLEDCSPITVTVFKESGDIQVHGVVTKVDQELKQIKFSHDDDWEWIKLAGIINAEV